MQGNERNKTELEDEFISEAWESMRFMLDREMPVGTTPPAAPQEHRSDRGLLLLLLLVCFSAGASLMYWYQQPSTPIPNINTPQKEIKATPIATLDTDQPSAPLNNQALSDKAPLPATPTKKSHQPNNNSTTPQFNNSITDQFTNKPSTQTLSNSPTEQLKKSLTTKLHTPTTHQLHNSTTHQLNNSTTQNSKLHNPTTDSPITFKWVPKDASATTREAIALFDALPQPLNPVEEKATELKPTTSLLKAKRWDYFAEAAIIRDNGTTEWGGFSTALNASYRLNPRFSLQAGLGWHRLAKTPSNPLNKNNDLVVTNETDLRGGSSNVTVYDPIDLQAASAPISTLDYLQMPLQLSYNVTKQLKVYSGCHVGYYLNSIGANKENPNERPFAELSEIEQLAILADTRNRYARRGLRKFDFGFQAGLSFVTKRNIGLFVSYNLGIRDISDNEFFDFKQIHNNRYLQLGLNYYLFNR